MTSVITVSQIYLSFFQGMGIMFSYIVKLETTIYSQFTLFTPSIVYYIYSLQQTNGCISYPNKGLDSNIHIVKKQSHFRIQATLFVIVVGSKSQICETLLSINQDEILQTSLNNLWHLIHTTFTTYEKNKNHYITRTRNLNLRDARACLAQW